jgi:dihydropteroate synthase
MKGTIHTNVMATLNVTPDSFSDDLLHNTIPTAIAYVQESIAAGATEEEVSRVLSAVQALRNPDIM